MVICEKGDMTSFPSSACVRIDLTLSLREESTQTLSLRVLKRNFSNSCAEAMPPCSREAMFPWDGLGKHKQ